MLPFELTKDTPYLALSGELWSAFYEYFNRNWPCYMYIYTESHFLLYLPLTHWGQGKMAANLQMLYSNCFSCMKVVAFWSKFHWHLFPKFYLQNASIGANNGLASIRQQAIIVNNDVPIIAKFTDASLRLSEISFVFSDFVYLIKYVCTVKPLI